jgi:hypothetical protein
MLKRALLTILLLICLPVLLAGAAELAVRYQPVQSASLPSGDLPTDNPWVKVRIDERLFTLFAALNAAGYDGENFGLPYHPVRQLVRERLAGSRFSGQQRLQAELNLIQSYNFVTWSLHYGGPPDFDRELSWSVAGIPAFLFIGLDGLLRDFYREMGIAALWTEVRPQYEQEAARLQQAAGTAVQAALDYTRLEAVPLREVVVIPNLLDAHYRGYGPQVGGTAYVIVGPAEDQPDIGLVQHEALHSIAGSLVEVNLDAIDPKAADTLYADLRKRVPPGYESWAGILEESVVRALDARLAGPEWEANALRNDEEQGFWIVRPLVRVLMEAYEPGPGTLADFMPELLKSLNEIEPQTYQPVGTLQEMVEK